MTAPARRRRRTPFETRILLLALLTGLPGSALGLSLLWLGSASAKTQWTLTFLVVGTWIGAALVLRERVIRPLQTLSNLLGALREGDFSIRARGARSDDALGLALLEINALSEPLRNQRLGALEATALLRTVMSEIDVAVFAFDGTERLRLVNRAGERLLGQPAVRVMGRSAEELGLAMCLLGETPRTIDAAFQGGVGRWEVRRSGFRQGGLQHELLVISDLSRALREEERQAWQRLIRVLSHEINNSLTPIQSIAGSLKDLLSHEPRPADWEEDVAQGLDVVRGRSAALSRFMASYVRLARLPAPVLEPVEVAPWVGHIAELEPRLRVRVVAGPDLTISADRDQLDQLLINLIRNAAEAALETGGGVEVDWRLDGQNVELRVLDEGPGITESANLFVPFFTTKPDGSGIGLVLSRQIAEAHGGTLTLTNRRNGPGCVASLHLPLSTPPRD